MPMQNVEDNTMEKNGIESGFYVLKIAYKIGQFVGVEQ